MTYRARINLKTKDIYDLDARMNEIMEITEWIKSLVHWHEDQFEIKYLSSNQALDVWFKEEKHAIICAMRWS